MRRLNERPESVHRGADHPTANGSRSPAGRRLELRPGPARAGGVSARLQSVAVSVGDRRDAPTLALACHPACERGGVERLDVRVRRRQGGLTLRFHLEGRLDRLVVPAAAAPQRRDGLWRHTCFEAFVRVPGEPGYTELNASPSGAWAAYAFDAYRGVRRDLEVAHAPTVEVRRGDGVLEAEVTLAPLPDRWGRAEMLRVGVSAVVEGAGGALAYWALAHPRDVPDFHHPDGFLLELRAE